jgi:hypothetical protein
MSDYSPYLSRRSISWTWLLTCLALFLFAVVILWSFPKPLREQLPLLALATAGVLAVPFTPVRRVLVDTTGIVITRTTLSGLFTRSAVCPIENIRRIRYRSDLYPIAGDSLDRTELRFFLDVITMDGQVFNLLTSAAYPPELDFGRQLARQLRVPYEEYLDAGAGRGT